MFAKKTKYIISILLIFLLEQVTAKYLAVGGAVPMFLFCFVVTAAIFEEEFSYIVLLGAVCGFLCDTLSGHGIGTYVFTFTLSALAVFEFHNKLFSSKILFMICAVYILSIFVHIVYFIFHVSNIGAENFIYAFSEIMQKSAIYNVVVTLIFMPIVGKLFKKGR